MLVPIAANIPLAPRVREVASRDFPTLVTPITVVLADKAAIIRAMGCRRADKMFDGET